MENMWRTPEWGSKESKFLNIMTDDPQDFYYFAHKTFPVGKPYTIRRTNINGKDWFIVKDPILGDFWRGMKAEIGEETVKKLNHEGRIKVLEG